jgi:tetratricopeptide (TPR) repeat protein
LHTPLSSNKYAAKAHYLKGMCAFVVQDWRKASSEMQAGIDAGSRSAEAYYMLSIAARKSNAPERARQAYETLHQLYPDSSFYHELTAEALDRSDLDSEAEKQIKLAIASDPHARDLHAQLGFLLWKVQQFPEAEQAFQEELKLTPNSYSSLHYLGDIAEKTNHPEQALQWYRQALQLQPGSAEAHYAVGRAIQMQGYEEEALQEYESALPQLQNDASLHYAIAKALKHLGRNEEARAELQKVREINEAERLHLLQRFGNGAPQ